jgi:serine/threonine protein kinase
MVSLANLLVGQILDGRFELVDVVGSGNFSLVFDALDHHSQRHVAVKLLHPARAAQLLAVAEFETEGQLLERMRGSRNIIAYDGTFASAIQVTLSGQTIPLPVRFHILELAEGSLEDLLPDRDNVDWILRLEFFREAVSGVHQMHLKRAMHRDVKCANALLVGTSRRDSPVVKLGDLGRSRSLDDPPRLAATDYQLGRGDPDFAPPEYIWGLGRDDQDSFRRADLYLLGSLLFELAKGHGLTAIAYAGEWLVAGNAHSSALYNTRIATLRTYLEPALDLFAQAVPSQIRREATALVRQLGDPSPDAREERLRTERRLPSTGLDWVLRRVDILRRTLILERRTKRTGRVRTP